MKKASRITSTLALAAMTGLVAGAGLSLVGCTSDNGSAGMKAADKAMAPHDCKGQNACKGQGGCKTGNNGCKSQNSCKGQGGCKVAA